MEAREGTEDDIPAIVELLRKSLGEDLMPKSERYWRWKHVENPFGPSPVLLCWEGNTLIGVRAFMRWRWSQKGRSYSAVRAVDTATHPDHQGKGIFKKLTMSLVESCTKKGDDFVFNTPNRQSKPGYFKMGWVEAGKLPVIVRINRPFTMLKNFLVKAEPGKVDESPIHIYLQHMEVAQLLKEHSTKEEKLVTDISAEYLKWRYIDVPVARYTAIGDEDDGLTGLLIGRIKETRFGRELRITDVFLKGTSPGKTLLRKLSEYIKKWDIDYCTLSGMTGVQLSGSFSPVLSVGPMVTIRTLAMKDLAIVKGFNRWSPSLGDLELF